MTNDALRKITRYYDAAVSGISDNTCVCVHGKPCTGKSELLNSVSNALLMNGANVFFSVIRPDSPDKKKRARSNDTDAFRDILRQLNRMYGEDLDSGLTKAVASYVRGEDTDEPELSDGAAADLLVRFIYECVKTERIVFVIDDLDRAGEFLTDLLGNLIQLGLLQFLVFSHTDTQQNPVLTNMLHHNTQRITCIELQAETDDIQDIAAPEPLPDEAMLALSRPGNEHRLIRHYIRKAQEFIKNLDYLKAEKSYENALDVCKLLKGDEASSGDAAALEILLGLSRLHTLRRDYSATERVLQRAYQAACSLQTENAQELRVSVSISLAECYRKLRDTDREREHIMLGEAFFCIPEKRVRHYDLYVKHIPKYLYLLAELDEKVIFREKLKQAYIVCAPDDKEFACALYCEESYMYMEAGDFEKAFGLLCDARDIAADFGCCKLWDDVTGSLAICNEQMGRTVESKVLWEELIRNSRDPVKSAEAMVNIALLDYNKGEAIEAVAKRITDAIDLCILAGDRQAATEISANLKDTPLAEKINGI